MAVFVSAPNWVLVSTAICVTFKPVTWSCVMAAMAAVVKSTKSSVAKPGICDGKSAPMNAASTAVACATVKEAKSVRVSA